MSFTRVPISPCNALYFTYPSKSNPKSELLSFSPRDLASNLAQTLQSSIPKLHRAELDHSRIQSQGHPHLVLYPTRSVESHYEVVAFVVLGLMLARSLRQTPDSPILDASYGASLSEHETAGCTGNSVFCQRSWVMAWPIDWKRTL